MQLEKIRFNIGLESWLWNFPFILKQPLRAVSSVNLCLKKYHCVWEEVNEAFCLKALPGETPREAFCSALSSRVRRAWVAVNNKVSRHSKNITNMHANERKNNLVPSRHTDCPFLSPKPRIAFKHTDRMQPRGLKLWVSFPGKSLQIFHLSPLGQSLFGEKVS